jgi:putative DNA methylase
MTDDKRLIEDFLPINAIARENTTAKGHINTLHLWWARRPLIACRAAVYGTLVPVSQFVPNGGSLSQQKSLGRANAAKFIKSLSGYPVAPHVLETAQQQILKAHAERLTKEQGCDVSALDIEQGKWPRPKVLDMFAGGGGIPLEALRLGCDAYANDLNPVAHIIQMCTLVFPETYGKASPKDAGATGPKDASEQPTWGGLAKEVRHWGLRVYERVQAEIGDLYPLIPDTYSKNAGKSSQQPSIDFDQPGQQHKRTSKKAWLTPVAYLWTRTIKCKNPNCGAEVPLVRQTWVCKREKQDRYVALKPVLNHKAKTVTYKVIEAESEAAIGFDPAAASVAGGVACPFCRSVIDASYAMEFGEKSGFGVRPMAIMCVRAGHTGKVYIPFESSDELSGSVEKRLKALTLRSGLVPPDEPLEANPRSFDIQRYGFKHWRQVFTERQNLMLLTCAAELRNALIEMEQVYTDKQRHNALYTCLALSFSRLVTQHNSFAFIHVGGEKIDGPWGDGKFPMSWDFAEANPFSGVTASYANALEWACKVYEAIGDLPRPATLSRGSATDLDLKEASFDAVITDPPYYDSLSYSNLSDAFYIWLKRSLSGVYPEHFASVLTPKRTEAIKATYRHSGDDKKASRFYEDIMTASLGQAHRILKPGGAIAIVYAHKTTLGWATLVDALRSSRFTISEAWPLATEATGGRKKKDKAMLASSIFLVARKREETAVGNFEEHVRPELEEIVKERVETLWDMGISGADLVIACVGAGLRAFTKYARVEYGNGEEVPAERFLAEVETVVLESILGKLSKTVGSKNGQTALTGLDSSTRFYVLWRYTYRAPELDAGEAIIFANGTHVELDGQHSLTQGKLALLKKKAGKYRLYDFSERGEEHALGQQTEDGNSAPVIDILHRVLWLMEHKPLKIPDFLSEAAPNVEQLRLVAQVLVGPALSGGELSDVSSTAEQSALGKFLANWSTVMVGKAAVEERRTGQQTLFKN